MDKHPLLDAFSDEADVWLHEDIEMDPLFLDDVLAHLQNLEKRDYLIPDAVTKDHIQTLKIELRFLKMFFKYIARNENLKLSSATMISAIKCVSWSLLKGPPRGEISISIPEYIKYAVSNALKGMEESRAKIRYFCELVFVSSQSYFPMTSDLVLEFISDLMQNLKEVLGFKANLVVTEKRHIEVLVKELSFIRNFLNFAKKRCSERERFKDLLTYSEAVAIDGSRLSYSCLTDQFDENLLSDLQKKIKRIKLEAREIYVKAVNVSKSLESADTYMKDENVLGAFVESLQEDLLDILNSNLGFELPIQDQLRTLDCELKFVRTLLVDPTRQYFEPENLDDLLRSIDEVIILSDSLIFSIYSNQRTEEITVLVDLLEKTKYIKAVAREMYSKVPKSSRSKFPRTDGLGFIQFFLENLKELLSHNDSSISFLKNDIETVQKDFESLTSLVCDMEKLLHEHEEVRSLSTRVIDLAYQAEYVIDSFVIKDGPVWYYMLWLSDIIEEIQHIKEDLARGYKKMQHETGIHDVTRPCNNVASSRAHTPTINQRVVGFEDEAEKLTQLLLKGSSSQLDVVSIVGMPGIGKTTLSKKIYNSLSVEKHFHVRAWCCVSQVYQKKGLLLNALSHVIELTDEIREMNEEDLAQDLYKCLRGRRYLLVMDDIWNIEAWHDIRASFPDDENGSRIMFTTQLLDVALQGKLHSHPHSLRLFSDDECWQLLQHLVFPEGLFLSELKDIGKEIANGCKGLPLSVVVIAGLLATDKTRDFWKQVACCLTSRIMDDPQTHCIDLIELSYKYLPDHLKPCFLYLGLSSKGPEIPVKVLRWLWSAEGCLRKAEGKSLDDTAEGYLQDLLNRSLLTISKRTAYGRIKACRVHDLLSYFCKAKSKEENFFCLIDQSGVNSDYSCNQLATYEERRLLIHASIEEFIMSRPSGSRVRSLHFLTASDSSPKSDPRVISFLCNRFELLRVLGLENLDIGDFPTGLELLVHLKYLAICVAEAKFVPPSMANLWNLETFLVAAKQKVLVPNTIWRMRKMRHFHVLPGATFDSTCQRRFELRSEQKECASFHFPNQRQASFPDTCQLDSLETTSVLSVLQGDEEEIFKKIPNIQKLRCVIEENPNSFFNNFPNLDLLKALESLNMEYMCWQLPPLCEINFPSILKELTLSLFEIPWTEISIIGRLENLEVLKLKNSAFVGQQWNMIDGEFPKLRHLQLDNLNLEEWNASNDHFPCLQRLQLQSCRNLEEVPSCLGTVETLEMIKVERCYKLDLRSVWQIQQEQEDMGNDAFKVLSKNVVKVVHFGSSSDN